MTGVWAASWLVGIILKPDHKTIMDILFIYIGMYAYIYVCV